MNRKQRRNQRSADAQPANHIATAEDIPLARPGASTATPPKTLLEIAAERQAQLTQTGAGPRSPAHADDRPVIDPQNVVHVKIGADGQLVGDDPSTSPWLDTLLLTVTLSVIHFTLEVLTVHQYAQALRFSPIIAHTVLVAFPTLTLMAAVMRGHLLPAAATKLSPMAQAWAVALRQLVYVVTANVAGCYLIQLTNDRGYYAVMKNAPGVGTVWVWAVLELRLAGALAGVIGPGIYAWWYGYGIF